MDVWTLSCHQLVGIKPPPPPYIEDTHKRSGPRMDHHGTCDICNGHLVGAKYQKYCGEVCAAEAKRRKDREAKRLTKPHMTAVKGNSLICPDCQCVAEITSTNQLRCKPCAKKHKRKLDVARLKQRRIEVREKLNASVGS